MEEVTGSSPVLPTRPFPRKKSAICAMLTDFILTSTFSDRAFRNVLKHGETAGIADQTSDQTIFLFSDPDECLFVARDPLLGHQRWPEFYCD
jgi:hypothetical protein